MKALKKTGTIVISVLLWLVILVAALYAFTTIATRDNQNVSSLLGYTPLVVKSDSMAPTFSAGDLIFIKKCDTSTLKEGDIICFHTIIDNEYALIPTVSRKSIQLETQEAIQHSVITTMV